VICPNCNETLRERERAGVEVDVCPGCRGIWLDRGELDKIIDRESRWEDDDDDDWAGTRPGNGDRDGEYRRDRREPRGAHRQQQPQKKKGFFQTLVENFSEGGEGGMD
jgi:Zn-finger nucleic acid-binding protein